MFDQVGCIGLGLIGASIAGGIQKHRLAKSVIACDISQDSLERGLGSGLIDAISSLEQIAASCDVIIIATPLSQFDAIFSVLNSQCNSDCIITDVASVKQTVIARATEVAPRLLPNFVPAHPIAGRELSGVEAAQDDLFEQHKVILTPTSATRSTAITQITLMWESLGSKVISMDAARHDKILAFTSHLPHLISFSFLNSLANNDSDINFLEYGAGGVRDFIRLASSNAIMWQDIFADNADFIRQALDKFIFELDNFLTRSKENSKDNKIPNNLHAKIVTANFAAKKIFNMSPLAQEFLSNSSVEKNSFVLSPGGSLQGRINVPADKSISHRAVIIGAISSGTTRIKNFLVGSDNIATINALRDLGVKIDGPLNGIVGISGVGLTGLKASKRNLYLGNSGTALRLLAGLLAGQKFDSVLTGDESLSGRPMQRIIAPLTAMGASITGKNDTPPLRIQARKQNLGAISYSPSVASAQVKSAILLAGLYARGETSVIEKRVTRNHTELMLQQFGVAVAAQNNAITLVPSQPRATDITVPADISSAAFFIVAATIAPGSSVVLPQVGINPTRRAILDILLQMGAKIEITPQVSCGYEDVADIKVVYSPLQGINVPVHLATIAIDEIPILSIAAAAASGVTVISGVDELRVKESDRIQAMADGLAQLGVKVTVQPDGLTITGGKIGGGEVDSYFDHRIAMSFAMCSVLATDKIIVKNCANVATSFPNFISIASEAGIKINAI